MDKGTRSGPCREVSGWVGGGGGVLKKFGGPLKKCFRKANIFPENFGKGVKEREVDGFFLKQNVQKFFQTLVGYNGGGGGEGRGC